MEAKKWTQMVTDEKTGRRVLVLTTLVNGLVVDDSDLGDEDRLRENNEF